MDSRIKWNSDSYGYMILRRKKTKIEVGLAQKGYVFLLSRRISRKIRREIYKALGEFTMPLSPNFDSGLEPLDFSRQVKREEIISAMEKIGFMVKNKPEINELNEEDDDCLDMKHIAAWSRKRMGVKK